MINIIIDFILILLILAFAYFGYKKGLIEVAFKIFSFVIAIVVSVALFKPVSYCIVNFTPVDETINLYVKNIVTSHMKAENEEEAKENSNLPTSFYNYIDKTIEETSKKVQNDVSEAVSNNITSTVVNILSFIVVFLVTKTILFLVHLFSDAFSKLPIIKQFNEMGGLIYGLLKVFLIVFLVLAIISILPFENVKETINNTYFTLFLYNINPILWLLL